MSTNFYLHDRQYPESVHLGKTYSAGAGSTVWITDGSHGLWITTTALLTGLRRREEDNFWNGWIADEYGRVLTPAEMRAIIEGCIRSDTELTQEFT